MRKAEVLNQYPDVDQQLVRSLLEEEVKRNQDKIVVLDDDPTGVQTVHDIAVYTDWSEESIRRGFQEKQKMFFILTNSRSFTEEKTCRVHREIAENLEKACDGRPYLVISRSDSTLRGHYPLETEILREELEKRHTWNFDGEILCPFFAEGGRYTIENIHYVKYGDCLIPASETEFAKDKTFGYEAFSIPEYVEEKSRGRYPASEVICISLNELRSMNYEKIEECLMEAHNFQKIVVNAIESSDVEIFVTALYRVINRGKHFLFRTAASFVKAMGNISDRQLLTKEEMLIGHSCHGGLIVAGSHTDKTTRQLEELKKIQNIHFLEFNSDLVLEGDRLFEEAKRVTKEIEILISRGITTSVFTKRHLLIREDDTPEAALIRSVKISEAVLSLVKNLNVKPAFIVAKGGITSSDIGVKALGVRRAIVLGQIQPGIPVWRTDESSRFPDIPYVIFPGNVGNDDSLYKVIKVLTECKE
ncbi:MAG: four-carbon acid sugar kinase family protein [Eubacteriales bacterium]|nr:four-carbon acid sugar kinase family protein [Eubacteriales bacterium]